MKAKKQLLFKKEINQMNMDLVIKLVTLSSDVTVMERIKVAVEDMEEHLNDIDTLFSPFRYDSLVSKFQRGDHSPLTTSNEFKSIYNSAILSEQMTNGIYRAYFAGRFDPSEVVKNWAIEQVFNDELKPLLENPEIIAIYLSGDGNSRFATKQNVDFSWDIKIADTSEDEVLTTYYLKNGAIATKYDERSHQQATIIRSSLVEAGIWSLVGASVSFEEFWPFVEHYNLTGITTDQANEVQNFNLGSLISPEKAFNVTVKK